jgi:tetratricopeptide (TPR) repeat protein
LEGTYNWEQNRDYVAAALIVQEIFGYLRKAEAIESQMGISDPELNLMKGYIELLLSVNLPLSNPQNAIAHFEENAAPRYLVDRGIALAYRDLGLKTGSKKPDEAAQYYQSALRYVNAALGATPNNPEVKYLKAQILHEWGKLAGHEDPQKLTDAIALFESALQQQAQLPSETPNQINRELGIAREALARLSN